MSSVELKAAGFDLQPSERLKWPLRRPRPAAAPARGGGTWHLPRRGHRVPSARRPCASLAPGLQRRGRNNHRNQAEDFVYTPFMSPGNLRGLESNTRRSFCSFYSFPIRLCLRKAQLELEHPRVRLFPRGQTAPERRESHFQGVSSQVSPAPHSFLPLELLVLT